MPMLRRFVIPFLYRFVFTGIILQAIDKLGRTARRAVDNHVKNALSKPKVATAIRRVTAMFNFMPDLS